jgi:superfamily II DNA/RNA helicase
MSLLKLRPQLVELLSSKGIVQLTPLQSRIIDVIKAGGNILAEGINGSGKTTSILFSVLQKIKEPGEGSPRVIISCLNSDHALELFGKFEPFLINLDLTVDLAHDKGNKLAQRNSIFDGTEIIIGTPKRLYELYIQNGFNVSQIKLFIVDDIRDQMKAGFNTELNRIAESLPKCQHLYLSTSFIDQRLDRFIETFIPNHVIIQE